MDYVVLPAGCPMSVREFLSDSATQTVHFNKARLVSAHGLFGLASVDSVDLGDRRGDVEEEYSL
jgi:hypothetical protein